MSSYDFADIIIFRLDLDHFLLVHEKRLKQNCSLCVKFAKSRRVLNRKTLNERQYHFFLDSGESNMSIALG